MARTRLAILGTRAYFQRHGRPTRPEDLASHRCFAFTEPRPMEELVFIRGKREVRVKLNVVMLSNNGEALMAVMRQGAGLCAVPSFMARADLDGGEVEPVLLDWSLPE